MAETSAQIRRVLSLKCTAAGIPVSGIFELTPRCNLNCRMCYVRMTPEEMAPVGRERTAKEWLKVAEQAKEAGMIFLLLTGGEPFLRSDFAEIYEELAKMGLSISINSNGTLLRPEIRRVLHYFPPAQINITLYGVCGEDYTALCKNPQAYERVVNSLDWLKGEGILTHLNATMIPDNLSRWRLFEDFAKERELELRMTTYCFPPVRCKERQSYERLTAGDAGELAVKDILYREGIQAVRRRMKDLGQPLLNSCKLDLGDPVQCMAGRSQFWVSWNGRMVPCGMLNSPASYPFESDFSSAWRVLREQTEKIHLCPDCVSCPEKNTCMNCAAVTYAETGRFDGKPEYMCRMNHSYREALLKYSSESKMGERKCRRAVC